MVTLIVQLIFLPFRLLFDCAVGCVMGIVALCMVAVIALIALNCFGVI